ncbi:bifunctional diguanylate cyclase/phosphodiesterase [Massilia sp. Leaf139]|uniref:putative bifunctional diguanylate cyclase/phosphodiesterase n=1 Tax=Massilia sp. Leaf139 TaxID=1736272 RepID=UPI000A657BED|nr:EAL domain-containing protein [Massilia sp. Leaf139]
MSSELPEPPLSAIPGGPAREALDWLYRFVAAIELSPAVAVHSQDRQGVVRFWNRACAELTGISADEAVGQPFTELVRHLGGQDEFDAVMASVWRSGEAVKAREWHVELRDGRRLWLQSSHFPIPENGETRQVFCMEVDVTARKELEDSLRQAGQVFDHARDAILLVDREHRVLAANRAYVELTGYMVEEVVGAELPSLQLGVQDRAFYDRLREQLDGHQHWEGELWGVRRDGSTIPIRAALSPITDVSGAVTSYMVMLTDISERHRAVEQARHQAEHDALTGLPNRILFMDRLEQALASAARRRHQFALMFIDLDHFKAINDNHGHEVGDAVLQEVAQRLRRCVRRVDTVSRLGGDEFVVLLADIGGVDQAAHVAATIMQSVARPIAAQAGSVALSVSIGIAICPSDGDDPKTLLRHADVAMYHAKESGRSAFQFFSQEMNSRVLERVQMENRLRQALENGEFELEYQPEIDIGSGRTVGFEALIRWRDPERGRLLPEAFIGAAEESGLIVPIGQWVLLEACRQGRRWHDAGFPVVVAVNLSNVQFVHDDLLRFVDEALQSSGLAPEFLDLEITEKTIMNGDAATLATVNTLRGRGVHLTIDDFGTGFSSLASLRRFPLSKLKIDRSFIEDIVGEPDGAAMIPAIIALARSLRLKVIAEGVETAEQLHYLRQHGCDEYQGFYAGDGAGAGDATGTPPGLAPSDPVPPALPPPIRPPP